MDLSEYSSTQIKFVFGPVKCPHADDIPLPNSGSSAFETNIKSIEVEITEFEGLLGDITDGKVFVFGPILTATKRLPLSIGQLPIQNFLGVPIVDEGEAVGVIGLANRIDAYTEDIRDCVNGLAQVAGVLYHNYSLRGKEAQLVSGRNRPKINCLQGSISSLLSFRISWGWPFAVAIVRIGQWNSSAMAVAN